MDATNPPESLYFSSNKLEEDYEYITSPEIRKRFRKIEDLERLLDSRLLIVEHILSEIVKDVSILKAEAESEITERQSGRGAETH